MYTETVPADSAAQTDLGWNKLRFDLTDFQGQTVRIHFRQYVPSDFEGPAMFDLDDISVAVERPLSWLLPEMDEYTLDLTGKAGQSIDIVLAGHDGVDFSGQMLQLLDTDGQTELATAGADPLGIAAENYDLAVLGFVVPAGGVYEIYVQSQIDGQYGLVVTEGAVFDSEPSGDPIGPPTRSLDTTGADGR